MCGIAGCTGSFGARTKDIIIDGLKQLEYRGYDSAGLALSTEDDIVVVKTVGRVSSLEKISAGVKVGAKAGIGHTRWATHGGVTEANAHPHWGDKVALVHNGVIDNADELRASLVAKGVVLESETDSEVIAHLIDIAYEECSSPSASVAKAVAKLHGTYGIAVLFKDHPGTIVAARNGSPLVVGICANGHLVASDVCAVSNLTNRFIFLEDGDIVEMDGDNLSMNFKRPVTQMDVEDIVASKEGYSTFMLKEICEQPQAIRRCIGGRIRNSRVYLGGLNLSREKLCAHTSVNIIACGTSYHAGLAASHVFQSYLGIPCRVEIASEFSSGSPVLDRTGLYIAVSQSGETYDTIKAIDKVQKAGIDVYAVVNSVGSTISRLAGKGVYIHAGPEIAVASTKAFTTQYTALLMLAGMMTGGKHIGRLVKHTPNKMKQYIGSLCQREIELRNIAADIAESDYCMFLGNNADYAIALEGALKLKEIAYVPCEAYPCGEMKHGPIAMIKEGTPVIALFGASNEQRMLSAVAEVKARGAKVIGIGHTRNTEKLDAYIGVEPFEDWYGMESVYFTTLVLQLLALFAAEHLGNDVDKPRNLAKSVTVG